MSQNLAVIYVNISSGKKILWSWSQVHFPRRLLLRLAYRHQACAKHGRNGRACLHNTTLLARHLACTDRRPRPWCDLQRRKDDRLAFGDWQVSACREDPRVTGSVRGIFALGPNAFLELKVNGKEGHAGDWTGRFRLRIFTRRELRSSKDISVVRGRGWT